MAVQGLASLGRKLKRLPELAREEIAKAMELSAEEMAGLMRRLVTSTRVRATIGWTWGEAPAGSMKLGTVRASGKGAGNMTITIFAGDQSTMVGTKYKVQLARLLEFGTAPHKNKGRFTGSEHPGTSPAPFFYPSWRAGRRRARGRVTRAITKSAKRAVAGG